MRGLSVSVPGGLTFENDNTRGKAHKVSVALVADLKEPFRLDVGVETGWVKRPGQDLGVTRLNSPKVLEHALDELAGKLETYADAARTKADTRRAELEKEQKKVAHHAAETPSASAAPADLWK